MRREVELEAERETAKKAARALFIIKMVMGVFILAPLILAWWFGALSF